MLKIYAEIKFQILNVPKHFEARNKFLKNSPNCKKKKKTKKKKSYKNVKKFHINQIQDIESSEALLSSISQIQFLQEILSRNFCKNKKLKN